MADRTVTQEDWDRYAVPVWLVKFPTPDIAPRLLVDRVRQRADEHPE